MLMTPGIYPLALGVAGLAIYGLPCLRQVIRLLFLNAIRCDYVAGPEAVTSPKQHPTVQSLVQRLTDLGFVPVGIRREWSYVRKPKPSIDLASPEGHAFATIFLVGSIPHLYFYTPMHGGGVVLTSDAGGAKTELHNFVRSGIKNATPNVLWEMHQEQVLMQCRQGFLPITAYDQQTRLDATRDYYAHEGAQKLGRNIAGRLLVRLAIPVCLIVLGTVRICLGPH
jgi:hypothetical protein